MDLTETEDIKKRWQVYTEELYKKDLHDPDNHNGVIIHLEPDILEWEVKWALGSISVNKASGGDVEVGVNGRKSWRREKKMYQEQKREGIIAGKWESVLRRYLEMT